MHVSCFFLSSSDPRLSVLWLCVAGDPGLSAGSAELVCFPFSSVFLFEGFCLRAALNPSCSFSRVFCSYSLGNNTRGNIFRGNIARVALFRNLEFWQAGALISISLRRVYQFMLFCFHVSHSLLCLW